jgi:hypothetical protein
MSEVTDFYVEFSKLEVEYEAYEPVYGACEPGSGGLDLGGPTRLSEQIYIKAVYIPVGKDKRIDILDGLTSDDIETLEDEIRSQRGD